AVGVITALTDKGYHVPEDVSVIGFDDSLVARYLHPKLSTVRYPIAEMATEAAEIAISRLLHSETPAKNGRYQPILIKRDSVRNVDRSKP
ncbi:substrate-binding domain-containing protein, partial [Enterovibrio norvegicus]